MANTPFFLVLFFLQRRKESFSNRPSLSHSWIAPKGWERQRASFGSLVQIQGRVPVDIRPYPYALRVCVSTYIRIHISLSVCVVLCMILWRSCISSRRVRCIFGCKVSHSTRHKTFPQAVEQVGGVPGTAQMALCMLSRRTQMNQLVPFVTMAILCILAWDQCRFLSFRVYIHTLGDW